MTNEEIKWTEETGTVEGFGEWKLEAVEDDHATLDFTVSASNAAEVLAAIAALQALLPRMAEAEKLAYGA